MTQSATVEDAAQLLWAADQPVDFSSSAPLQASPPGRVAAFTALAALVAHHRLPPDAAFALFATARSVGLLAHSLEQLSVTQVIRPRGRYVGLVPEVVGKG